MHVLGCRHTDPPDYYASPCSELVSFHNTQHAFYTAFARCRNPNLWFPIVGESNETIKCKVLRLDKMQLAKKLL